MKSANEGCNHPRATVAMSSRVRLAVGSHGSTYTYRGDGKTFQRSIHMDMGLVAELLLPIVIAVSWTWDVFWSAKTETPGHYPLSPD